MNIAQLLVYDIIISGSYHLPKIRYNQEITSPTMRLLGGSYFVPVPKHFHFSLYPAGL